VSDTGDQPFNESVETFVPREGLPRQYRMRADRHYVDQLADASGQPVRMIPIDDLDGAATDATALRPLIESVRRHGVLQPLLVRRDQGRFRVIAGSKRLLAAATVHMLSVPCLVHDVADDEVAAIADADNLRVKLAPAGGTPDTLDINRGVAAQIAAIRRCADLSSGSSALQGAAVHLLKAHAWRASLMLDALNLIGRGPTPPPRERSMAAIIDEVVEGFAAETRLSGVSIRAEVREPVMSAGFNDHHLVAGISGALLAVLALVEQAVRPVIVLRTSSLFPGELLIELIQTASPVAQHVAAQFFAASVSTGGDCSAAVGALAARALADAYAGDAGFERLPNGSRLALRLQTAITKS